MTQWWKDFRYSGGHIYVRTTGARVPITPGHTKDVLNWFGYYAAERMLALPRLWAAPRFALHCVPARPRAWYLLWAAAFRARIDVNASLAEADAVLYFEDQTRAIPPLPVLSDKPTLNFKCTDISKSRVQQVFAAVFGYALGVDPKSYAGPMVVKSEQNGAHDGRIVMGPCPAEQGLVYQRVIDNQDGEGVADLRCPTVGGTIPLVFIKRRPLAQRFENLNTSCTLSTAQEQFSPQERAKLSQFCSEMGLDWGGLDVLRDKDGRIYVVDVNKTDMGPPLILTLKDKMKSAQILGDALGAYLARLTATPPYSPPSSSPPARVAAPESRLT